MDSAEDAVVTSSFVETPESPPEVAGAGLVKGEDNTNGDSGPVIEVEAQQQQVAAADEGTLSPSTSPAPQSIEPTSEVIAELPPVDAPLLSHNSMEEGQGCEGDALGQGGEGEGSEARKDESGAGEATEDDQDLSSPMRAHAMATGEGHPHHGSSSRPASPGMHSRPISPGMLGGRPIYRPDTAYSQPPAAILRTHGGVGEGQLLYQIGERVVNW